MSSTASPPPFEPVFAELPEPVRRRVLELASAVLPGLGSLPPSLKRVAEFAPQRRARAGAGALATALGDDQLRSRIGHQVSAQDEGSTTPADVAAVLWLTRPENWREDFASSVSALTGQARALEDELARLRHKVESLETALVRERAHHQTTIRGLRDDVKLLRERLGKARAAGREQGDSSARVSELVAELDLVRAELTQWQERAAAAQAVSEQLAQSRASTAFGDSEPGAGQGRADRRAARLEGSVRARMLLDVLVEASTGLRRELGLPATGGAPADRVEAELAQTAAAEAATPRPLSRAEVDTLLSMPKARLIIDGYNVSRLAWPALSLEVQRERLVQGLAGLVARTGVDTVVVFDAYAAQARPVRSSPRGIKVFFSAAGELADDAIRMLVAAEPPGRPVVVVTNDREVADSVQRDGARVLASEQLIALL